jgi:hypothetical protein
MLQIRIRHRLPTLAMIALYVCLALLTVSSTAQNLPGRSCRNTVNFLEASGQSQVPRSEIYDSLKDGEHKNIKIIDKRWFLMWIRSRIPNSTF